MAEPFSTKQKPAGLNRDRLWILLKALTIIGAVLWIYSPVFHGDWLWDDGTDITENAVVHSPNGLWTTWTEPAKLRAFYPITFSLEWIEWHLWGMDTLGYHLVNVGLHLIGSFLVWRLLAKLGLRLAWLGGLIFAVHPVQVESVAWIAEIKNALCLPPFLLAMCAWINYEERRRSRDYWLSVAFFLIAMLCKTSMAGFPFVILLYAWWKRGRIGWDDVKATMPFFVILLVVGFMSYQVLQPFLVSPTSMPWDSFFSRTVCAGLPLSFYFSKCFLPLDLMPIYPYWSVDPPSLLKILPLLLWGGVLYVLWTKRHGWGRHVLFGLGYFLLLLAPFLGLIQTPYMYATRVMDHELYLAIIGPIGLTIAFLDWKKGSLSFLPSFLGEFLGVFTAGLLAWNSHIHAKTFVNSETLWTDALAKNPKCWIGYVNLGGLQLHRGNLDEAMALYRKEVEIDPANAEGYCNIGLVLLQKGEIDNAIIQFQKASAANPAFIEALTYSGNALIRKGKLDEAIVQYRKILAINPSFAEAHTNIGRALLQKGEIDKAIAELKKALEIAPNDAHGHYDLGVILEQANQSDMAIAEYQKALQINPNFTDAHNNLGLALVLTGQIDEAIEQYQMALAIKPDFAEGHNNLGIALFDRGEVDEAMAEFREAIRLKPDYTVAQKNLIKVQEMSRTNAKP